MTDISQMLHTAWGRKLPFIQDGYISTNMYGKTVCTVNGEMCEVSFITAAVKDALTRTPEGFGVHIFVMPVQGISIVFG